LMEQILLLKVSGHVSQFPLVLVGGWSEIFDQLGMFL
jgi:hypothetical protein